MTALLYRGTPYNQKVSTDDSDLLKQPNRSNSTSAYVKTLKYRGNCYIKGISHAQMVANWL